MSTEKEKSFTELFEYADLIKHELDQSLSMFEHMKESLDVAFSHYQHVVDAIQQLIDADQKETDVASPTEQAKMWESSLIPKNIQEQLKTRIERLHQAQTFH